MPSTPMVEKPARQSQSLTMVSKSPIKTEHLSFWKFPIFTWIWGKIFFSNFQWVVFFIFSAFFHFFPTLRASSSSSVQWHQPRKMALQIAFSMEKKKRNQVLTKITPSFSEYFNGSRVLTSSKIINPGPLRRREMAIPNQTCQASQCSP